MGKSSVTDAASKSTNGSTAAAEAKVGPETITLPNGIQVKPDYGSMHFQSLINRYLWSVRTAGPATLSAAA